MPAQVILLPGQPAVRPENRETERIKEKLLSLPAEIAEAKKMAREQKTAADEIRGQMQNIEAEILYQINTATNNAGKPLFGNETMRNAELKRRLAQNPEYQELKAALQAVEAGLFEAEALVNQLIDEFRAWKAVAELTAAELAAFKN
ncbi:hypothetical protein [Desulfofundulus thermosubterraneus]|uniref:Uncharacterized protein n=1 Tax=Desulfofundulus thermosubterraneus DSM 16057 TaxID=1121432 RepID=A0A1M6F180_9FIRM|nr:hypothetical protein [Desulfofundulus thermosubterraneus]SHI91379.1 hypothetical protein SAMN02745219_01357 [Desulfofundulus thermosubterraneus DSM 16057]